MGIEDFKFTTTEFLPEEFFNGQLEGWAVFEGITGGLQKRAHNHCRRQLGRRSYRQVQRH